MRTNFGPSSESSSPQPQRLPVNPRRRKVAPEERKRVVRACNACNVRRVKCTGEQPCQRCHKASRQCEYPQQEKQKHSLKDELERLQQRCAALEAGFQAAAPDEATDFIAQLDQRRAVSHSNAPTFNSMSEELDEADSNHGRLLVDSYGVGRFFGETSGATFLDHLKQFMLTLVPLTFHPDSADGSSFVASVGSYQTYDSRPFPNPNVDPLWLPAQPDMASMLGELRAYIQDGNGEFVSGGIYWWGDLSNSPAPVTSSVSLSTMTSAEDSFRYLAFYHVSFALATSLGQSDLRRSDQHAGEAYFNRARKLLGNPLDIVRFTLSDVSVLALMGFYLIELNRRDAAYVHVRPVKVSLAIHIAIMHGAFTACHDEASKRTFWTLYIMDRWLSVLMGRPPTIPDEAMRLPLPCDDGAMPPCAGLRAHIELSRISGYIVCETFKIAPRNYTPGYSALKVDKAVKMLVDWKSHLPQVLAADESADPAVLSLHLAANQLMVLTTRPILLAAVKQAVAERYMNGQWSLQQHAHITHIQACLEAAHGNLVLAERLRCKRKLLQAGLHFVFNAAVILFLEQILSASRSHPTPPSPDIATHGTKLEFAIRTFADESKTGTNYPRDCFKILQDLKALVHRYLSHSQVNLLHGSNASLGANAGAPGPQPAAQPGAEGQSKANSTEASPLYQEMRIWIQSDGLQLQNSLLI
ncbi:Fungal specific transcription factor domain-containing protein [Pyrenophora tritici-repentis]|nr:Fungal specific transcription factor domain-containing protein [Pyrenophora tritici-repentis]KAI0606801.1 Fungal specific transcription factor domain-containing protein [Pyrenophora tritici-repentis]KAI1590496.1 fungal specific transcription factor domain-containing protein [Pyrenophora tritici-repentis]KAI1671285.1 Fungal specific transcription factor domain-containing protein [Pyrenophora tritici-repentis]KAI1685098.1 Fungal specific transcription factor domain-containing protein [Pyrenoph